MTKQRFYVLVSFIALAALFRLVPHPPNFAPVAAIALFAGAYFPDRRSALLVPMVAMLLSDMVLGFHGQMLLVYGCFAATVGIGRLLQNRVRAGSVALATVTSSVLFFVVTNFGVWALSGLYPLSPRGLIECYVAGIPFYQNSLFADGLFAALLFGGFTALEHWRPALRSALARSA